MTARYTIENGRRYKKGFAPSELAQAISATCGKCGGPAVLFSAGLICRRCSFRKERAGRLTIRAGARRKRRYLAWIHDRDEYPARPSLLVQEAAQLTHRLYMVSLGVPS